MRSSDFRASVQTDGRCGCNSRLAATSQQGRTHHQHDRTVNSPGMEMPHCLLLLQRLSPAASYGLDRAPTIGTVAEPSTRASLLDNLDFRWTELIRSRLEGLTKRLDRPILVSDDFARACDRPLSSLGFHPVRGFSEPAEIFGLPN